MSGDHKMTHNELAHSLAVSLVNENRIVWEDIPVGKAGSIRPDVYTIQKSFAHPNPISYEVKVSTSDFRSDITKGKWCGYLDYSYGVVFAVEKGLITKKDLPIGCGLITFNGEYWNTVKRPTIHPKQLDTTLLLKLIISGSERQTTRDIISPRSFDEYKAMDKIRQKFGKDIGSKLAFIGSYDEKREEIEGWYEDLYTAIGKKDEYTRGDYLPSWDLNRSIKDCIKSCNKDTYINKISKDLDSLEKRMSNLIQSYKKDLEK